MLTLKGTEGDDAGYQNTARVWDAETGKPVGQPMMLGSSERGIITLGSP